MRRKGGRGSGAVDGRGRTRYQARPGGRGSRDRMSPIVSEGEAKEGRSAGDANGEGIVQSLQEK